MELLESQAGARVSIYITAPTEQGFPDLDAVPLRYQAAVREARRRLEGLGVSEDGVAEATRSLLSVELDLRALQRGTWTVGVFQGPGLLRVIGTATRLTDRVYVGRSFSILPLLEALHLERRYLLLALSTSRVALYEGGPAGLVRVDAPGVPRSIGEALGERIEPRDELQQHRTARRGAVVAFHGQGGVDAGRRIDLDRFYRVIAHSVAGHWGGRREPIVLAADDRHQGRFRAVAQLPHLLDEGLEGNPDAATEQELHDRAWAILRRSIEAEDAARRGQVGRARNLGLLVDRFEDARDRAVEGSVHRLWIRNDLRRPGILQGARAAERPPHADEDALEELAGRVLQQGGEVIPVRPDLLPEGHYLAAELRSGPRRTV